MQYKMCVLFLLSIANLLHGAAEDQKVVASGSKLAACFSIVSVPFPGPAQTHVPVILGCRIALGGFTKLFSGKAENKVKIWAGFVSGFDAAFTKKVAENIINRGVVPPGAGYTKHHLKSLRYAAAEEGQGDLSRVLLITHMNQAVSEFECTDSGSLHYQHYKLELFDHVEHGIIVPANRNFFDRYASPKHATVTERLAYIQKRAAELCAHASECHDIPILVVDQEKIEALARDPDDPLQFSLAIDTIPQFTLADS